MNVILRIIFAVVVGVLVTAVLEWLTSMPHNIDVLLGVVAFFLAYWQAPAVFNSPRV